MSYFGLLVFNKYRARSARIGLVALRAKKWLSELLIHISLFFSAIPTRLVCLICPLSVLQRFIACVRVDNSWNGLRTSVPFHAELLSTSDRYRPFSALSNVHFGYDHMSMNHCQHWEELRFSSLAYSHDRAYRSWCWCHWVNPSWIRRGLVLHDEDCHAQLRKTIDVAATSGGKTRLTYEGVISTIAKFLLLCCAGYVGYYVRLFIFQTDLFLISTRIVLRSSTSLPGLVLSFSQYSPH
jgi:hypothetical protein